MWYVRRNDEGQVTSILNLESGNDIYLERSCDEYLLMMYSTKQRRLNKFSDEKSAQLHLDLLAIKLDAIDLIADLEKK